MRSWSARFPAAAPTTPIRNGSFRRRSCRSCPRRWASAPFVSRNRSEAIIKKLKQMAGPTEREYLDPGIAVSDRIKARNDQTLYNIQEIKYAILRNERITFKYYEYDVDLNRVAKHKGYEYEVSPYAMIWKKDRYYLIGWSERHNDTAHFRIDHIAKPVCTGKPNHPMPEDLVLADRSDKIFSMFDGREAQIVLRCHQSVIGQAVDQFGEDLKIIKKDGRKNWADISVIVHLAPTFFSWVFQYGEKMKIISPEDVRTTYANYLQNALDDALGDEEDWL